MKKYLFLVLVFSLILSAQAFAAGSGSGGSVKPPQTESPEPTEASQPEIETSSNTGWTASDSDETPPTLGTPDNSTEKVKTKDVNGKKWCNDLSVLVERIECRLKKSDEEIKEELANVYMPEECRAYTDEDKKNSCVERYKSVKPCFEKVPGKERVACVKQSLGIDKLMPIDKYCEGKDSSCEEDYKMKIYNLITFRFYDAEERVEEWYAQGKVSLEDTIEFIAFIVDSKLEFYAASSKEERVKVIESVMNKWDEVTEKLKAIN